MPQIVPYSTINPVKKIMSSFKVFERKLEKLQEDVNIHGNALSDLRCMLADTVHAANNDLRKTTSIAIQYEEPSATLQTNKKPRLVKNRKISSEKKTSYVTATSVGQKTVGNRIRPLLSPLFDINKNNNKSRSSPAGSKLHARKSSPPPVARRPIGATGDKQKKTWKNRPHSPTKMVKVTRSFAANKMYGGMRPFRLVE